MSIDKREIVKKISACAKDYQAAFENRNYLFIYKIGDSIAYKETYYSGINFLHLTGIRTTLSARNFYKNCLNNRLSPNDIELRRDGSTIQKLNVLPFMKNIICTPTLIGNFNKNGFNLETDYLVGDTRKIITLGFSQKQKFDIVNSLLAGDVKQFVTDAYPVIATCSKGLNQEKYCHNTYTSKHVRLSDLMIEEHIKVNLTSKTIDGLIEI